MKDNKLYTEQELKFFKAIEKQEFEPLPTKELKRQKAIIKKIAENTINKKTKKKHFNIRLFESDIDKLKATAMREGMPYQTYLASIIHKIATGQIKAL